MSSSLPSPGRLPGRPLPGAVPRKRTAENRILAIDWAWIAVLATVAALNAVRAAHGAHFGRFHLLGALWLPIATAFAYLSALVMRDRYAAVVAGVLTAASVTLATVCAASPVSGVAIACLAATWFLYDRGWLVASAMVCGAMALCRPEMISVGVLLAAFGMIDKKEQGGLGVATFVIILVAFFGYLVWCHEPLALPNDVTTHGPVTVLWASGPAILWFIVAFLTDLFDKHTRPRWMPIAVWLPAFLVLAVVFDRTGSLSFMAPAFVAGYIVAAAGVARVLPAVAGDHGTPVARYVAASLAVLLLLCLRYPSDSHAAAELRADSAGIVKAVSVSRPAISR